jgi:hypothetical protein
MNRKFMANADTSTWTPLDAVAGYGLGCSASNFNVETQRRPRFPQLTLSLPRNSLLHSWVNGEAPPSGSLAQLVTKSSETQVVLE